jgi:hypothetical protein
LGGFDFRTFYAMLHVPVERRPSPMCSKNLNDFINLYHYYILQHLIDLTLIHDEVDSTKPIKMLDLI